MKIKRSTALIWAQLMGQAAREVNGKTWYALAKMGKELHNINKETEELRSELVEKHKTKDGKAVQEKGIEEISGLFNTEVEFVGHTISFKDLQDFPNKYVKVDIYSREHGFNLKDFQAELFELGIITE